MDNILMTSASKLETTWQRFGSLINTCIIVGSALGFIWYAGRDAEKRDASIRENAAAIVRLSEKQDNLWIMHNDYHKTRATDVSASTARIETRISALEAETRKISAETDRQNYRLTTAEGTINTLVTSLKEIQNLLGQQTGDLREIKVILQGREKAK